MACVAAWGIDTAPVEEAPSVGARDADAPDLEVVVPLPEATADETEQRWVGFRAAVPAFEIGGGKLDPDISRTRFVVGATFRSRTVAAAKIDLALLDDRGEVLCERSHTEELGPERVVHPGHNLDLIREWDTGRALWFDFPIDARAAKSFRVQVRLVSNAAEVKRLQR